MKTIRLRGIRPDDLHGRMALRNPERGFRTEIYVSEIADEIAGTCSCHSKRLKLDGRPEAPVFQNREVPGVPHLIRGNRLNGLEFRHGQWQDELDFFAYDGLAVVQSYVFLMKYQDGRDIPPEKILDYAAEDADVTLQLDAVLRPRAGEAGALPALEQSEEPLVPILVEMESAGVRIDVPALRAYGATLDREIGALAAEICSYGDGSLNLDSPQQLSEFLFGKLGLDSQGVKKTQRGFYATDEKTLVKLAESHPVVGKILEYRACAKLKSTYVDKLPQCLGPDGRVHTTFAQAFTETGRLSSSDPNLQNIPIRTERGKPIRAAFIARDADHRLISADYSQIELRIMAAMSGDETMLDAFANGADIHRETAARVYDVMPALVTDEMRSKCKMVNFGIIYGISAFGLSQRLHIPRREAADLIDAYFSLYPKIRAFMDASIAKARETGYAVTALGRRRTLRDISSRNATARQAAERDAINTPIQGTAADLIKLEMSGALDLGVPLDVSVGVGNNWLEAH